MTVIAGATINSPSYSYGGRVTTDIDTISAAWGPGPGQRCVTAAPAGTLTRHNVATLERSLPGAKMRSYLDDFYYRVHVIPGQLDLGYLIGDSLRNVTVWNAHFTSKSYTGFSGVGTDGITVSPPVSPSHTFNALEEQTFPFTITMNGPPTVDAVYTWVIGGEAVQLRIDAERTVPFAFPPNWADGVVETLSFMTDVLQSFDGTEQRVSLRSKPRRSMQYSFQVSGREWARMQNSLWGWHKYTFALPLWTDVSSLTSDAALGTSVINLDTTSRGFRAEGQAILWVDANTYEVVAIDSVAAGSLTLKRVTQKAWPALTRVYPVELAHLPNNVPVSKVTDNVATGSVTMNMLPVVTDARLPTAAAAVTYNGYEVLLDEPNWSGDLNNASEQIFGMFDNQTGNVSYFKTQNFARSIRGMRWLLDGRAAIDSFRARLKRLNGRQKAVYIPTFSDDLPLQGNAGLGAGYILVDSPKLASLIGVNDAFSRIVIEMNNGTRYYHKIVDVIEQTSGLQNIGLYPTLTAPIVPGNVRRISFMPLYRLGSDDVPITWVTDSVATVEASFVLVTE